MVIYWDMGRKFFDDWWQLAGRRIGGEDLGSLQSSRAMYMPLMFVWSRRLSWERWGTAPRDAGATNVGVSMVTLLIDKRPSRGPDLFTASFTAGTRRRKHIAESVEFSMANTNELVVLALGSCGVHRFEML